VCVCVCVFLSFVCRIQFWFDIFNSHGPCFHFQLRFRGNMLGAEIVSNELSLDPSSVSRVALHPFVFSCRGL
jgi:hypothetical protein